MTTTVTFKVISGATTQGEILWIAEVENDGSLVAHYEFETMLEAEEFVYNF